MSVQSQEYRARAEECRRKSEQCNTEPEKQHWLELADEWLRMGETPPAPVDLHGFARRAGEIIGRAARALLRRL
jgi:hypothetical protein